jgi:hypothetical protein
MTSDPEGAGMHEGTVETDESRLKRFDKRIEEWLLSLKDEANERSPEVLSAMATKAKDVAQYLERMADQARAKRTDQTAPGSQAPYSGPDPAADPKGDGADEDQGT